MVLTLTDTLCCWRCGAVVPESELIELERLAGKDGEFQRLPDPEVRTAAGTLWTGGDAHYCATCAPEVAVCRRCGCTDENACEDGCWWVAKDLCSTCAAGAGAAP